MSLHRLNFTATICLSTDVSCLFHVLLLQVFPNTTDPHFTMASEGLTYAGGEAAYILFETNQCMTEDPAQCKEDDSLYYGVSTHSGHTWAPK